MVFCTYFKAKGLETTVSGGQLTIRKEGAIPKFVDRVDQITFSGTLARAAGKEVLFLTERCVFRLEQEGLTLVEIAPGVDLERDILTQMAFLPMVSEELKEMDRRIFIPGRMGCFDGVID